MLCRAMEIGLLGSRKAYALKEPYILVYLETMTKHNKFKFIEINRRINVTNNIGKSKMSRRYSMKTSKYYLTHLQNTWDHQKCRF